MGMYDTIRFFGDGALLCPAGHPQRDLQTKDLECALPEYVVHLDRLYRVGTKHCETAQLGDDSRLVLVRQRFADPVALTAKVVAYTHCERCQPVLYLRDNALAWGDYVQERHPRCEWRLVFVAGAIERREAVRIETREIVGAQLRKEGLEVLDDYDRLARLHFDRLERRNH